MTGRNNSQKTEKAAPNSFNSLNPIFFIEHFNLHLNRARKTEQEKNDLIQDIKTLKPDVVFVAMGSPKQELLMEEMQKLHQATYQGLGGSFDVYTGHVERAPQWWVKSNLEWAYRLIKQPSRIKKIEKLQLKLFQL